MQLRCKVTLNIEVFMNFALVDPFDLDLHTPKSIGLLSFQQRLFMVRMVILASKLRPVECKQMDKQTNKQTDKQTDKG